ncbi:MAG: helix-turn-helix domain-containing protein [Bacteroides sp.]|nr:helix-turn-helix domain-containing protein [Prevotella sp.]MCM1406859.1 helix-turn-helix domain-containing protein [Treponema brennaborense]MCM1470812.1 helix-turn-helix domain-containing protein [Bacteroides sp.]
MSNEQEQEIQILRKLKAERKNAKMSQLELSLESGVSQNMITYIETGKRTPTLRTLLKLCNALNISPAILFSCPDNEKEKAKQQVLSLIRKYL